MPYSKPIKLEKLGHRSYRLLEDVYVFGVVVPKGFVTDGASVPRIGRMIISPMGKGFRAALKHDFATNGKLDESTARQRWIYDVVFRHSLQRDGYNAFWSWVIYLCVRAYVRLYYLGSCRWADAFGSSCNTRPVKGRVKG